MFFGPPCTCLFFCFCFCLFFPLYFPCLGGVRSGPKSCVGIVLPHTCGQWPVQISRCSSVFFSWVFPLFPLFLPFCYFFHPFLSVKVPNYTFYISVINFIFIFLLFFIFIFSFSPLFGGPTKSPDVSPSIRVRIPVHYFHLAV